MHRTHRQSTSLIIALLLSSICVAGTVQVSSQSSLDPRIDRVENGLLPAVLYRGQKAWSIRERMKFYNIPGVSVAVFANHEVQWAKGYGVIDNQTREPVTDKTLFLAGSISKPVAVMAGLRLVQEGKLSLDSDINKSLASWKVSENTFTSKQPVTLAQLMSHTAGLTVSGFGGYAPGEPLPTLVQILNGAHPANSDPIVVEFVPGSQWRYSGGGLTVMQQALIDVEKRPFPEILREKVLDPIGMTSSSFEQTMAPDRLKFAASGHKASGNVIEGKRYIYPEMAAAGLWATPSDLAKFAIEIDRSALGESNKVLTREMAKLMVTSHRKLSSTIDMALGLFLVRRGSAEYFTYDGQDEGFIASLFAARDEGCGVVIMTNSDGRSLSLINEITMSVAKEYGWPGYAPDPYEVITLDAKALTPFTGKYLLDSDSTLSVSMVTGGLVGKQTGEPVFELLPISKTEFIRADAALTYTFADGKAAPSRTVTVKSDDKPVIAPRVVKGVNAPADWLEAGDPARAIKGYRALWKKNPKDPNLAESRINDIGYGFLSDKKLAEAIALFKLNVELHSRSWSAFDSLGEAYMQSGEKALAIANYEKSLALNPNNTAGAKKLERLKNK